MHKRFKRSISRISGKISAQTSRAGDTLGSNLRGLSRVPGKVMEFATSALGTLKGLMPGSGILKWVLIGVAAIILLPIVIRLLKPAPKKKGVVGFFGRLLGKA